MDKILQSVKDKLSFLSAIFILPICRLVLGEKAFNELVEKNNEDAEKQTTELINKNIKEKPGKNKDKKEDKNLPQKEAEKIECKETKTQKDKGEKNPKEEIVYENDVIPADYWQEIEMDENNNIVSDYFFAGLDDEMLEAETEMSVQECLYDMMDRHMDMEQREIVYDMGSFYEDNIPYFDTLEGQGDVVNDFREELAATEHCDDVIPDDGTSFYPESTVMGDIYTGMSLDDIERYDIGNEQDITEEAYYREMDERMRDYDMDR